MPSASAFHPTLHRLGRAPLLTAEAERDLAERVRAGGDDALAARDAMVLANVRLVFTLAKGYRGLGLDLDDLVGHGMFGLLRAVELYDPDRGWRFSTYASRWIRQAIRRGINNTARFIRVPVYAITRIESGRYANADPEDVPRPIRAALTVLGAEVIHETGQSDWTIAGLPGRPNDPAALEGEDEETERAAALRDLDVRLDRLSARDREIVRMRAGIGRDRPAYLSEIGRRFGLSKEAVRKIVDAAMVAMADPGVIPLSGRAIVEGPKPKSAKPSKRKGVRCVG